VIQQVGVPVAENKKTLKTPRSAVQQVVLAMMMVGVAIVFILIGRDPGWRAYIISGSVAILFLAASLAMWKRSNWLGVASLAVLYMAMLWDEARPASGIVGALLAFLSAWMTYSQIQNPDPANVPDSEQEGDIIIK
jgi:uncharacterized membrane protein YkgB